MKSKKALGENKSPLHTPEKKSSFLFARKGKRTPEEEILAMREERKKTGRAPKDASRNEGKKKPQAKKTAPAKKTQAKTKEKTPAAGKPAAKTQKRTPAAPVRIIPLGGLGEIGKNMTAIESGGEILVIDCGLGFPDDDMFGIDLVIPDTTYLEENARKVKGIFVTHGHEDHIGAIPYILRKLNVPIYGTKLTLGIVENKLMEFELDKKAELHVIAPGETVKIGAFDVEAISVNHSIADAVAFAVYSPCGILVFTGDFKIDSTPIDGEMTDLTRFGELGREGVTALFCESTNCERPGFTPSERTVGTSFEQIFDNNHHRVIVATFSSNIHRVQQIIDASVKRGRVVCILGRSMINIVATASKLGYMRIPEGALISPEEIRKFKPEQLTLITTGSQGEAMSALSRMAFGSHDKVRLGPDDMVVLSSHPIPGNEKAINDIINELSKRHVSVVYDQIAEVHVSGHACQEEIKMIIALTKPRFFVPVHGEHKHLARNAALAEYAGIPHENIFISEIGKVLEISANGQQAKFTGTVPSGRLLVDGLGVGDVRSAVLRDRKLLAEEGIITIVALIDANEKLLLSAPQIATRGFVYVKENEDLISQIGKIATDSIIKNLEKGLDLNTVKNRLRDDTAKFLFAKTRRRPMIVPMIVTN